MTTLHGNPGCPSEGLAYFPPCQNCEEMPSFSIRFHSHMKPDSFVSLSCQCPLRKGLQKPAVVSGKQFLSLAWQLHQHELLGWEETKCKIPPNGCCYVLEGSCGDSHWKASRTDELTKWFRSLKWEAVKGRWLQQICPCSRSGWCWSCSHFEEEEEPQAWARGMGVKNQGEKKFQVKSQQNEWALSQAL